MNTVHGSSSSSVGGRSENISEVDAVCKCNANSDAQKKIAVLNANFPKLDEAPMKQKNYFLKVFLEEVKQFHSSTSRQDPISPTYGEKILEVWGKAWDVSKSVKANDEQAADEREVEKNPVPDAARKPVPEDDKAVQENFVQEKKMTVEE